MTKYLQLESYKKFRYSLVGLLLIFAISNFVYSQTCPVIQFQDMRGVIGFPQLDRTSRCGDPDTMSILVFTDAPGSILSFNMTVNMEVGMAYGGAAFTQYPGTSIAYSGGGPNSPEFSLTGVTGSPQAFIANILVAPDCKLDIQNTDYFVSIDYEYTYETPMGSILNCTNSFTIPNDFNSSLKSPVLNMFTPSPVDAIITAIGTQRCQNIIISQDGLQSELNEFTFQICGVPEDGILDIVSMKANGINLPFIYNPSDSTSTAVVGGTYFPGNSFPNPADDEFNTNERITMQVCYNVTQCPTQTNYPFKYKAYFGCNGDTCDISTKNSFIKIQPSGAANPTATAVFNGPIEICGDEGTVTLTVTNPGAAGLQNTYTDLTIGYETCDKPNLEISEVRFGSNTMPVGSFGWVGDDLYINFDSLTSDIDGPGVGLTDADGDGFYDDLPGGATITLEFDIRILCGVPAASGLDCPVIDCDFAQFFVRAKSNCGNTFNKFPSVTPFNVKYGPESVSNPGEVNIGTVSSPLFGYDFGQHGDPAPMGSPITGMIDYEFCYEFESANVSPCPGGAQYALKLTFAGDPRIVNDYEVVSGSMFYYADGGAMVPIPDANAVFMPDPMNPGVRMLTITGGAANNMVCYKLKLRLDTAYCSPRQYVAVTQQVVESCPACSCDIVKACKNTQFVSDPEFYNCPCIIGHNIEVTRKNLGWTDHTMASRLDRQTILNNCPADLSRFGPGDTMAIRVAYDIKNLDAVTNMNMWAFVANFYPPSSALNIDRMPLVVDSRTGGIVRTEIVRADGTVIPFSFNDIPDCDSRTTNVYNNHPNPDIYNGQQIQQGFPALADYGLQLLDTEFDVQTTFAGNSSIDDYDGSVNTLYVRNAKQSNECGTVKSSSGGNCLQAFFDMFNFQVGDSIVMYHEYQLKRNPARQAAILAGFNPPLENTMRIITPIYLYKFDEYSATPAYCYSYYTSSCNSYPNVDIADYGGVKVFSEIDLNNCGGQVKHTFEIEKLPPIGWYQCEFRPIAKINDVDVPIFGPFAYCNNAKVTDYNGNIVSVTVDSTINANCTNVIGYAEPLCTTENSGLGDGKVVFDLTSQGIRPLGVGLMNDDSLCLSYNMCALCPTPFTPTYELIYDWSDVCDKKRNPVDYQCNVHPLYPNDGYCDDLGLTGNWYRALMFDTLQYKLNRSSKDFIINDMRVPDAGVSTSNLGPNLLASGNPGVSAELQPIEICNADATLTQLNVKGSVTVPSSVKFNGAFKDAAGTMPLSFSLVSDDGEYKSYSINTMNSSLAPGQCETVYISTTLLYCPAPSSPPPTICAGSVSGCAPPEVSVALGGNGLCSGSQVCYSYITGEVGIQTEWFLSPSSINLCEEKTYYIRVKNVKTVTVKDLITSLNIPEGLIPVSGSWQVAYPGGAVDLTGNFGPWTTVPDPTQSGTDYTWLDDALWSSYINSNGLPGVTSNLDSNKVSFRFKAVTDCDNFLSGSQNTTETTAKDPCGPGRITTGVTSSPPLIISGANPADFGKVLVVANPKESYCTNGPQTFGLTALNIDDIPTGDSVITCITLPQGMVYTPNSLVFTSPAYTPSFITVTTVGTDTKICFDAPKLEAGEKFSVQWQSTQDENAMCGPAVVMVDVKSFIDGVMCTTGPACGVFVQNSINPSLIYEFGPPLKTTDVRIKRDCSMGADPAKICYEIDLVNTGPNVYNSGISVDILDDVFGDGEYNAVVDLPLASHNHGTINVMPGDTVTLTMCLNVPAIQACPILIKTNFTTSCGCDYGIKAIDNLPPSFIEDLEDCITLCPMQSLTFTKCADYIISALPTAGATITTTGNNVSISLNPGFGLTSPVIIKASAPLGSCTSEAEIELKSVGDYTPTDLEFDVCQGECIKPDLMIPENISGGGVITITKLSGTGTIGTNLNTEKPKFCASNTGTGMDVYNVEIVMNPTCSFSFDVTINILPIGILSIADKTVCNQPGVGGTISAGTGFTNYQFFKVLPNGALALQSSGPSNSWTTSMDGKYVVKATSPTNPCPSVSDTVLVSFDYCTDLALQKEITGVPPYPIIGSLVTYRIRIHNQGGTTIDDVTLSDYVPVGLKVNDVNWLPNNVSNATTTRTVTGIDLEPGDFYDVNIVMEVLAGANGTNTTNRAEITTVIDEFGENVSTQDIDSDPDNNPNNDPGGNPNTATDNSIDGNGTGTVNGTDPSTDEDDHDPASLPVFDLALTKRVDAATLPPSGMYVIGDMITFNISVINQGTIPATDVVIKDWLPCGMSFSNAAPNTGWSLAMPGVGPTVSNSTMYTTYTIDSIGPGQTVVVPIKMTLLNPTVCAVGTIDPYRNFGSIESTNDGQGNPAIDIDSNPGSLTAEEAGTVPNTNGDNNTGSTSNGGVGSQDDNDPANIQIFDLALSKTQTPALGIYPKYGDLVPFTICVTNQGNVMSDSINIVDYLAPGFTFTVADQTVVGWTNTSGLLRFAVSDAFLTGLVGPTFDFGEQICVPLRLRLTNPSGAADAFINVAEIESATRLIDPDDNGPLPVTALLTTSDNDSDFNAIKTDDAGGNPQSGSDAKTNLTTDPSIQGNGTGMPGDQLAATDEDDADPALINVVDFALTKMITTAGPYKVGDTICYAIKVYNQGTVTGENIEINDYLPNPTALSFINDPLVNPGWTGSGGPGSTQMYVLGANGEPNRLYPGDTTTVIIKLLITGGSTSMSAYTNKAEIRAVFDTLGFNITTRDVDSRPDSNPNNDSGGAAGTSSDDVVSGTGILPNGTPAGAPNSTNPITDEDDHDPAFVEIVDLALTKVISTPTPYSYGQLLDFTITVFNQGNTSVQNVGVVDYLPAGFMFDLADNPGWNIIGNQAYDTIPGPIAPGASVTTIIKLKLIAGGGVDGYTNRAEITNSQDINGNDNSDKDQDSRPDEDVTNDAGGNPNSPSDNSVNGTGTNGSGIPGDSNAATDEDDADPAKIEIVDLALHKKLITAGPYTYGQNVTFAIKVYNQGTVNATNVMVTDYIPAGFMFIPQAAWSIVSGNAKTTIATLNAGDSITVNLMLKIQMADPSSTSTWTNVGEISMFSNSLGVDITSQDIDSDGDTNPTNDAGGVPNSNTDDTVNNENGDEDDQDPALLRVVDVASNKTIVSPGPYAYGQIIDFKVKVVNQGNVPLTNIVVTDYLPSGFEFDQAINPGWSFDLNDPTLTTYTFTGPLNPGQMDMAIIKLKLLQTNGGNDVYTNVSEVSSIQDTSGTDISSEDIDSDINSDPSDNGGGEPNGNTDDVLNGDGTGPNGSGPASGDEDNSDPAKLNIFDLAVSMEDTPANNTITSYGQNVTFPITLENQGNVASNMPKLTVNVPAGFVFNAGSNPGWVNNGDGTVSYTYPGVLNPGDSISSISLVLTSQPLPSGTPASVYATAWTPEIEIAMDMPAVPGLLDIDSDPDANFTNDAGGNPNPDTNDQPTVGSDDALNGNGTGAVDGITAATDEDDNDPEYVRITDLAIRKVVVTAGPYTYGQLIDFRITVFNQGNVTMDSINISDYLPVGYGFASANNPGWTGVNGAGIQTLTYSQGANLLPGDSSVVILKLSLLQTQGGLANYTNVSEISYMQDPMGNTSNGVGPNGGLTDVDSPVDTNPSNDGGGSPLTDSDNSIDGNGTGAVGSNSATTDEDNSDPAYIEVVDLALRKTLVTPAPHTYGQTLTFNVTVFNQGNVNATNIMVTDFIPVGYMFVPQAEWTLSGANAKTTIASLAAGSNIVVPIQLKLIAVSPTSSSNDWTNISEITMFRDTLGTDITTRDIDSDADADPANDKGGEPYGFTDDEINGDGTGPVGSGPATGDEDDHDPEVVEVFDLALTKRTMMMTGNRFGDTIQFMIMVENQGNVVATNVKVSDYIPSGFAYIAGINDPLGWSLMNPGLAMITIPGQINPGQIVTVNFSLQIMMSVMNNAFVNYAEISAASDTVGNMTSNGSLTDIDSRPDATNGNDAGGQPLSEADNYEDGNGTGAIGDGVASTDEDDHDPALITVVDIAMKKTVVSAGPFRYGDTITFAIEVENQGNVPLRNIKVSDYIPQGMSYLASNNANGWMIVGSTAMRTIPDTLDMWETKTITIDLRLDQITPASSADSSSWVNQAEISRFEGQPTLSGPFIDQTDEDIDGKVDGDPNNNNGNGPNTNDDDFTGGNGFGGGDDDHSDPALPEIYDIALTKKFVSPGTIYLFGDVIPMNITVFNQGSEPVYNVALKEYIPGSLTNVGAGPNTGWTFMGNMGTYTIAGPINPGDSVVVPLDMKFQAAGAFEDYINYAEVSDFENGAGESAAAGDILDADSDPDATNGNDNGGVPSFPGAPSNTDDYVDGNGLDPTGAPGLDNAASDEDDHDPLLLGFVDLALKKVTNTQQIESGGIANFTITVTNQGTIPSGSVTVTDYIPTGFALAPGSLWTDNGNGTASITLSVANGDFAAPGLQYNQMVDVMIDLIALPSTQRGAYINFAEISGNTAPNGADILDLDIDSDGDSNPANDKGGKPSASDENPDGSDNVVDGDGSGMVGDSNPDTDEDDHDPAVVCITPRPDIVKDFFVCPGETVTYRLAEFAPGIPYFNADNTYTWTISGPAAIIGSNTDTSVVVEFEDVQGGLVTLTILEETAFDFCQGSDTQIIEIERLDPLACNNKLNISVDENCQAFITPTMVLKDQAYPDESYSVEITDKHGNIINNPVGSDQIGKSFKVKITQDCFGQSCWSDILIEDKLGPKIECHNDTMSCLEFTMDTIPVTVIQECSQFDFKLLSEVPENLVCDPDYIMKVTQTWTAVDEWGNYGDTCTRMVLVRRPNIILIDFPINRDFECSDSYEKDKHGNPSPSEVGIPTLEGIEIYPSNNFACNIFVDYEDEVLDEVACVKKIIRTWRVREWWCNSERRIERQQIILMKDLTGPVIKHGATDFSVTTSSRSCTATVMLQSIEAVDACHNNLSYIINTPRGSIKTNGGKIELSVGENEVIYNVYDGCYNLTSDTIIVTVRDETEPVAICDRRTVVSLNASGENWIPASVFDDGSFDECGLDHLEVRRMDRDHCGTTGEDDWGPEVVFCCTDVSRTIMVGLKAVDKSGNYNVCMVTVEVQDKNMPRIVSPPNIEVDCRFSYDITKLSNSFGKVVTAESDRDTIVIDPRYWHYIDGHPFDGIAYDNCSPQVIETIDTSGMNQCGMGVIIRKFVIVDGFGNRDSAYQRITIENHHPMSEVSITWPEDYEAINICDPNQLRPELLPAPYNRPSFVDDECSLIGIDYKDHLFTSTADPNSCYKIFREWKVIDWCYRDDNNDIVIFRDTQVILVNNTIDPIITQTCRDTTICSYDVECRPIPVTLSIAATDNCTNGAELLYRYKIDYNSDGTIDVNEAAIGNPVATGTWPLGRHTIKWEVEDRCGNTATCQSQLNLLNCKPPTAYAHRDLSVGLTGMDTDGDGRADTKMAIVWARDLDAGSNHNCGYPLVFSFSRDTSDTRRVYTCDSIGPRAVELWVTDPQGNTSFVKTLIIVNDNPNQDPVCPSRTTARIAGLVSTELQEKVELVEVELKNSNLKSVMTNFEGNYDFGSMFTGGSYVVKPRRNDDWLNGVSTADIVKIQKHILGKEPITSAYDMIAADVNNSKTVTSADISELRKLILGITQESTKNTSWRFVASDYSFSSVENALNESIPEEFNIPRLETNITANFTGIKIGDLTHNAKTRGFGKIVTRNNVVMDLSYEDRKLEADQIHEIVIKSNNINDYQGFQTTIEIDPRLAQIVEVISSDQGVRDENMNLQHLAHGIMTVSWNGKAGSNDVLLTIKVKSKSNQRVGEIIKLSSAITQSISVDKQGQEGVIQLRNYTTDQGQFVLLQNEPNPWMNSTNIGMILPEAGEVNLTIYDANGKVFYKSARQMPKGFSEWTIVKTDIMRPGVYYYQADYKTNTKTYMMVLLD